MKTLRSRISKWDNGYRRSQRIHQVCQRIQLRIQTIRMIQRNRLNQVRQIIQWCHTCQALRQQDRMAHCNQLIRLIQVRVMCHRQRRRTTLVKTRRLIMLPMSKRPRLRLSMTRRRRIWQSIQSRVFLMQRQRIPRLSAFKLTWLKVTRLFLMVIQLTSRLTVMTVRPKRMKCT